MIQKWKSALENSDPIQVLSIDSTQQAAVMFISPFNVTGFKIFPQGQPDCGLTDFVVQGSLERSDLLH